MKFLRKISRLPVAILFFFWYSILSFLSTNLTQVDLSAATRLLVVFGIGTVLSIFLVWCLTRNLQRAGMIVFTFILVFYTYGHVKTFLWDNAHAIARNRFLVPIALVLFLGGLYLVLKLSRPVLHQIVLYLNLVSVLLLVFPIVSIIHHEIDVASYRRAYQTKVESNSGQMVAYSGAMPDVYFIILDGYARSDVLQEQVGLDNSGFLNGLRQNGFYVASCSMSNYAQTEQSLASTLNMEYLDQLLVKVPTSTWDESYFAPWIQHSLVRRFFESLSYKTVNFFTGYYWAQWEDASYFFYGNNIRTTDLGGTSPGAWFLLTSFENTYIDTVWLQGVFAIYQEGLSAPEISILPSITDDRSKILFPLDNLPEIAKLPGPKFTFLHLLLPHPPYVFGPNGEARRIVSSDVQVRLKAYSDQVQYADSRVLPLVSELIAQSKGNVIIILEGDHGLLDYQDPATHMKNLSAYYFPDQDYSRLYPQITPVNTFRVVLSQYFGQNYPLLPDVSRYSANSADQTFELIPSQCTGK